MAIVPFTDTLYRGLVGQQANAEEWNTVTRVAVQAGIGMGQPVSGGTSAQGAIPYDGATLAGIAVYQVDIDTVTGVAVGQSFAVMTAGVLYVAAGGACTKGAQAFWDAATDRWSNATGVAIPGVEFDTTATAGNIVKIRIQRTSPVVFPE